MKLYYSPGSCSTSCHITLEESGLQYEAIEIDWENTSDPNLALITKLNPLGTLPILVTDEGKHLDQNLAIHTYIADQVGSKRLLPTVGTLARAEAMNWLAFVTSDLHKSIGGFFSLGRLPQDQAIQGAVRTQMLESANEYLNYLNTKLLSREYLTGENFTPADAYAFVVLGWTKWLEIPLAPYPQIESYLARVAARPAVAKVLKEEGLA